LAGGDGWDAPEAYKPTPGAKNSAEKHARKTATLNMDLTVARDLTVTTDAAIDPFDDFDEKCTPYLQNVDNRSGATPDGYPGLGLREMTGVRKARPEPSGRSIFFHPDYTVGTGVPPVQFTENRSGLSEKSRAMTAGRELPEFQRQAPA
jgi:hypothetical protein